MTMYVKKLAALAKVEGTYGTDSTPTAAANAVQCINVKFTPLAGSDLPRDVVTPYLGNQGIDLVGNYQQMEFDVEMGGGGAAGTPPPWGQLIRGCGMSEVIVASTSVTYAPVSAAFEGVSMYYFLDGIKYIQVGSRGKWSATWEAQKKPLLHFVMSGLLGTLSDTALPAAVYTGWFEPPVVSKAATQFTLGALAAPMSSLMIDGGQDIQPRFLVNYEAIEHADRNMIGTLLIDQNLKATKDWRAIAQAKTLQALSLIHGTVAGSIVTATAAGVQIGRLTHGDNQGVANQTLPLNFRPTSGNDELALAVT